MEILAENWRRVWDSINFRNGIVGCMSYGRKGIVGSRGGISHVIVEATEPCLDKIGRDGRGGVVLAEAFKLIM